MLLNIDTYYSAREAAEFMHVSHAYILQLISRKKFSSAIMIKGLWIISKDDIHAFQDRRSIQLQRSIQDRRQLAA